MFKGLPVPKEEDFGNKPATTTINNAQSRRKEVLTEVAKACVQLSVARTRNNAYILWKAGKEVFGEKE